MAKQDSSTKSSQPSRRASRSRGRGADAGEPGRRNRAARGTDVRRTAAQPRQRRPSEAPAGGGRVATAGAKVVDTLRENPIPAALVVAGVTWLIVKNRQRLPMPHMPALSGLSDTARESFNASAEHARRAVRGGLGSAAEAVKDGGASIAEFAQSGAAKVGRAARNGFARSRDAVAEAWDTHPLAVSLGLLAAGVAAGMMLPAPKGRAITRAARNLTQRVATTGEELLDTARGLVTASARAASREAKRQGLTPAEIGRKVKRVASAVTA